MASVKQVELLAIREGMQLVRSLGLIQVEVETDSKEAVEACGAATVDLSSLGFIAKDIYEMVSELIGCSISFVSRECNGVARCLAKSNLCSHESRVWFEEFSDFIQNALSQDLNT